MGYANLETMAGYRIVSEYDAAKDVVKFEGRGDFVTAGPGTFVVFTPEDAHMPCVAVNGSELVRKVVVKVRNFDEAER
jgi:YhcH/YjgK/YiaL family protein